MKMLSFNMQTFKIFRVTKLIKPPKSMKWSVQFIRTVIEYFSKFAATPGELYKAFVK